MGTPSDPGREPTSQEPDRPRLAMPAAWLSLVLVACISLVGKVQPRHPIMAAIPGFVATLGIASGLYAVRFGFWQGKALGGFAVCVHAAILIDTAWELHRLG